jgi:hypothetical protein
LYNLTNLHTLQFGDSFNQPLDKSSNFWSNLTNLHTLQFGDRFNQSMGDILIKLTNLCELHIGKKYSQSEDNILLAKHLTNLRKLQKKLKKLTNLHTIKIGDIHVYNAPFDNL